MGSTAPKYGKDEVQKWAKAYSSGNGIMKITSMFHVDYATVRKHLETLSIYRPALVKRVPENLKKKIADLYLQKYTTREIGKEIGFSKTTVHKLLKKLGINRGQSEAKIVSYYRNVMPLPLDHRLSLFLGIHAGDGSLSGGKNNRTRWWGSFNKSEMELAKRVASVLENLFSVKPKLIQKQNQILCWNKQLFITLLSYGFKCGKKARTVRVPEILVNSDEHIIRAFLCGLLASDGSVYIQEQKGKRPLLRIEFNTVSRQLADGIMLLIAKLGYPCSLTKHKSDGYGRNVKYKVRVLDGTRAIVKFIEEVGVTNPLHAQRFNRYCGLQSCQASAQA